MTVTNDLHVLPTVPLSSELSNTGYTIHWTLKMLHDHNPTFVKARGDKQVKDITAYDISDGKGYLSHVYKTTVTFDSGDTYRFIMKVPTFQCLEKAMDDMGLEKSDSNRFQDELKDAHNLECTAYELIRDVVDFPKPHVYFTQRTGEGNPGLIVMNDLSETATTIGIFKSITVDHCINAARHFATFHAQMNSRNDWKGKFEKNFHCSSFNRFEMPKMCQKFIDEAPEFTETVKKMRRVDYINFSRYALMELPKRYGAITLLNGDCWTNNVMIKLSEDGSLSNEIASFIDWQILMEGNSTFDFARFITLCADGEVRREAIPLVIDAYYNTLTEASKGKPISLTKEQTQELFEYAQIQQSFELMMMCSFFIIPSVTAKVEPKVFEAQKQKLLLRARFAFEDAFELMDKYEIWDRFPNLLMD